MSIPSLILVGSLLLSSPLTSLAEIDTWSYDEAHDYLSEMGLTGAEIEWMSRLVYAECGTEQVFPEPYYAYCGTSVVSSLLAQVGIHSGGDVRAPLWAYVEYQMWEQLTLVTGDGYWNFPPWVTHGCEGLYDERACHDGKDLTKAIQTVAKYFAGFTPLCEAFPYYHSIPGEPVDCLLKYGEFFIAFHDGWHAGNARLDPDEVNSVVPMIEEPKGEREPGEEICSPQGHCSY